MYDTKEYREEWIEVERRGKHIELERGKNSIRWTMKEIQMNIVSGIERHRKKLRGRERERGRGSVHGQRKCMYERERE